MKPKVIGLLLVLLTPLWLCILYRILPLGSIGPAVPLTWLINSALLPAIIFLVGAEIRRKPIRRTVKILAIPGGLILAYFQFISYMPLTVAFELNDFEWI